VIGTDEHEPAARDAASIEGLRDLIQDVCRANENAWNAAGRRAGVVNSDLSALSFVVDEQRVTGVQLRQESGLASSSVTELTDRLEHAGLIRRTRGNHDRRLVIVEPTRRGRRVAARALDPLHGSLTELASRYQADELETLVEFLVEIRDALIAACTDPKILRKHSGAR
jgi:DNA-binding MarR family transcriptional regulator